MTGFAAAAVRISPPATLALFATVRPANAETVASVADSEAQTALRAVASVDLFADGRVTPR